MALNFYKGNIASSIIDSENPLFSHHDGFNGSWNVQKVFIRNDNVDVTYDGVRIAFSGASIAYGEISPQGVIYQIHPSSVEPTLLEWKHYPVNYPVDIEYDFSDTSVYVPFWIRVYVPGGKPAGFIQEASLRVEAIERGV